MKRLLQDVRGAVLVEYALVAASLAVGMFVFAGLLATEAGRQLTTTATGLASLNINVP